VPKLIDEAREDETIPRTFHIEKPSGGTLPVRVTFYPNKSDWTPPPVEEIPGYRPDLADEEIVALRSCAQLAELMESWDMLGPWPPHGEQVCGEGEMIPISVPVLRTVKPWITIGLNNAIQEAIYPNLRRSRESRRRG
jgi:hypothetical protein